MTITSVNPATGSDLSTYDTLSSDEVGEAVVACHRAQRTWAAESVEDRAPAISRAAGILRDDQDRLARLMAREMGKPVTQGRSEVEKCAWLCEYFAEHAGEFLAPEDVATEAGHSFVAFEPLGVILAVMPWNFPLWQVFRAAIPALLAGNGMVLKHASNVPGCALACEEILNRAGLPGNLFRALLIGSDMVNEVIDHGHVRGVTVTGSVAAGRAVAERAGRQLKKTVLELGGSDAYVILEDADVEAAAATCVKSRLINSGQSCIAAKRFVVAEAVRGEFERLLVRGMAAAKVGDPIEEDTEVGPQAREDLRDDLHRQVQESIQAGARLLLGGEVPEGTGAFYPPSVLTDVAPGMPAYEEELFGPVAAIIPVDDEDRAIAVANDSVFGLGAAVFTRDTARGEEIATRRLEAGACFVNTFVRSDPRLPFGGIKDSGYGRELSRYGIREFVNIKTVYVE